MNYYLKLAWSFVRWFLMMLILLVGTVTAPIVYPVAYVLRQPLRIINEIKYLRFVTMILYIYLDDEDYETPPWWWLESKGLSLDTYWNRFVSAYRWNAFRNTIWNFHLLTAHDHKFKEEIYSSGLLFKNGRALISDVFSFAVMKYVDIDGNYSDNNGVFLSRAYSYFGRMFCIYKNEGSEKIFWRFSYVRKTWLFGWVEIQLGTNDYRYTFRVKLKGKEVVFEEPLQSFYK